MSTWTRSLARIRSAGWSNLRQRGVSTAANAAVAGLWGAALLRLGSRTDECGLLLGCFAALGPLGRALCRPEESAGSVCACAALAVGGEPPPPPPCLCREAADGVVRACAPLICGL